MIRKQRKQRKKTKKSYYLQYMLLLILILVIFATQLSGDYNGSGQQNADPVNITVRDGMTTKDIAQTLKENGVIKYPLFFRILSKSGGHDGQYKQGTFGLTKNMGYEKVMERLKTTGTNPNAVKITIPEGYELRQIADKLEENGLIDRTVFYDLVENEPFAYDFLENIPKRENRLEGYLFPDTYIFEKTDDEKTILNAMLKQFNEVYTNTYKARAKELGMTTDQIVTLASVIEREAQGDGDRATVSSVFHNRLKDKKFPYLQSCATVQYILKERKAVLSESDTKIKSPYNTYVNKGLPIGPIASPGKASIEAALYPENTDYLFFALDSSGKHRFAKTYEEHLQNTRK